MPCCSPLHDPPRVGLYPPGHRYSPVRAGARSEWRERKGARSPRVLSRGVAGSGTRSHGRPRDPAAAGGPGAHSETVPGWGGTGPLARAVGRVPGLGGSAGAGCVPGRSPQGAERTAAALSGPEYRSASEETPRRAPGPTGPPPPMRPGPVPRLRGGPVLDTPRGPAGAGRPADGGDARPGRRGWSPEDPQRSPTPRPADPPAPRLPGPRLRGLGSAAPGPPVPSGPDADAWHRPPAWQS